MQRGPQRQDGEHEHERGRDAHQGSRPEPDAHVDQESDQRNAEVGVPFRGIAGKTLAQPDGGGGRELLACGWNYESQQVTHIGIADLHRARYVLRPEKLETDRNRGQCEEDGGGNPERRERVGAMRPQPLWIERDQECDAQHRAEGLRGQHLLGEQQLGGGQQSKQHAHPPR